MSSSGEPNFFRTTSSDSPRSRQKFCGVFCPVDGSADSKAPDSVSSPAAPGRGRDGGVIDRQSDISQPRKVEIRESSGKEALQNLGHQRVTTPACPSVSLPVYVLPFPLKQFCSGAALRTSCRCLHFPAGPWDATS